jgi:hypothetical protein
MQDVKKVYAKGAVANHAQVKNNRDNLLDFAITYLLDNSFGQILLR